MSRVNAAIARLIRQRANHRCEYCRVPQAAYNQRFCVDHVIARQHGGIEDPGNLAFCCPDCNLHKGPNIAGIDPDTGAVVPLFHPRRDEWAVHFAWREASVIGLTPTGRATVSVLSMNSSMRVEVRRSLITEGLLTP